MKRIIRYALAFVLVVSLMVSENEKAFASTTDDILVGSSTFYGDYYVKHELKTYKYYTNTASYWRAKCDHYASNIQSFGYYCYCRIMCPSAPNNDSGRCYAYCVGERQFHSETFYISADFGVRAYAGTEPH